MISAIIEAVAISNEDIHTRGLIATYTATGEQTVVLQLRLSGLTNTAASITVEVEHTTAAPATLAPQADVYTSAKPTATDTVWAPTRQLGQFTLKDGEILNVYALSTNASDTTVAGEMLVLNANAPSTQLDVAAAAVAAHEAFVWLFATCGGNVTISGSGLIYTFYAKEDTARATPIGTFTYVDGATGTRDIAIA